jgi:hypothetical protein
MLFPREELLWVGRPFVPFAPTIASFLFGNALLSFRFRTVIEQVRGWLAGESIDSVPWVVLIFVGSMLFTAVGVYRAIHAKQTTFALTSMRAVYLSKVLTRRQFYATTLHPTSKVTVVPCLDGSMDLMIESKRPHATREIAEAPGPAKQTSLVIFNQLKAEHGKYLEVLAHEVIDRLEHNGRYEERFYVDPYAAAR